MVTGAISFAKAPDSIAASARRTDSAEECVLFRARECVLVGGRFGEVPHHVAVVGVLQTVEKHVVQHLLVTHAVAAARLGQQVRCIAHGLHAAGHHDVRRAGPHQVVCQHGGLHAGAADLVDGGAANAGGQSRGKRGLARGRLAERRRAARSP